MSRKIILPILIFLIAVFLRFYQLGQNPPSLTWDEAAWGYNAYSLGIDGRDEFGRFLPLDYLESFGDYKPPVYAYLTVIPVKLFGLNEFSTRFASAFFGSLSVLITYFLVLEIFKKSEKEYTQKIALLSSFFLAISPWHINLSRAAFEANVASFFIITGVWLFLKGLSGRRWILLLSTVSFVLSLYTFNTARIVSPLIIFVLVIAFYKKLLEKKKELTITIILTLFISIPFLKFITTPQSKLRFHEVNIFSDLSVIERTNQKMENDQKLVGAQSIPMWSRLIHNRRFAYSQEYLKHYFDNLSPAFLFINGDGNPKFSTQDVGELYIWDLAFLIAGILVLIKEKRGYWWVIPVWLILGIIPAAAARETPHALRIETVLPTFQIIVAVGFVKIISLINEHKLLSKYKRIVYITISIILFVNFLYYIHGYYFHYPYEYSGQWQYGYSEAINYIERVKNDYDKIVFTNELGRPYVYTLFYTKENPESFRLTAKIEREVFGFVHVNSYGKFVFEDNPSQYHSEGKILYVDIPERVPNGALILQKFYLLNREEALIVYTI